MASAKFLEEALSTDVDESAVSAIVGSLENQLVTTQTGPSPTEQTVAPQLNHQERSPTNSNPNSNNNINNNIDNNSDTQVVCNSISPVPSQNSSEISTLSPLPSNIQQQHQIEQSEQNVTTTAATVIQGNIVTNGGAVLPIIPTATSVINQQHSASAVTSISSTAAPANAVSTTVPVTTLPCNTASNDTVSQVVQQVVQCQSVSVAQGPKQQAQVVSTSTSSDNSIDNNSSISTSAPSLTNGASEPVKVPQSAMVVQTLPAQVQQQQIQTQINASQIQQQQSQQHQQQQQIHTQSQPQAQRPEHMKILYPGSMPGQVIVGPNSKVAFPGGIGQLANGTINVVTTHSGQQIPPNQIATIKQGPGPQQQTLVLKSSSSQPPGMVQVPMTVSPATTPAGNIASNAAVKTTTTPSLVQSNLQILNMGPVRPGTPVQTAQQSGKQVASRVVIGQHMIARGPGQPGGQITLQTLQQVAGTQGHLLLKTESGQYQLLRVGPPPQAGAQGSTPNSITANAVVATPSSTGTTYRIASVPAATVSTATTTTTVASATAPVIASTTVTMATATTVQTTQQTAQRPTLDNTKEKCRKFLANLLELSSREPKAVERNVRTLIQELIDCRVEPEEFCVRLERLLNASPQPCLIGFLRKSLPLLRQSLVTKELVIDGIRPPPANVVFSIAAPSPVVQQNQVRPTVAVAQMPSQIVSPQVVPQTVAPTPVVAAPVPSAPTATTPVRVMTPVFNTPRSTQSNATPRATRPVTTIIRAQPTSTAKTTTATSTARSTPSIIHKAPVITAAKTVNTTTTTKSTPTVLQNKVIVPSQQKQIIIKDKEKKTFSSAGYTGDDDINDVAAMGGVNLAEESQRILGSTKFVGTQIRSCKDEVFLHLSPLQQKINEIVTSYGLEEPNQEVAALISHAAQERLKNLVEKLAVIAEHRIDLIKVDPRYEVTQDVRAQLKFLEELDRVERKRHEEQEREVLLKAAKSRAKTEDPEQAKLKAKAKEMQRAELEEMRTRDANLTALQAIGPRKKPKLDNGTAPGTSNSGTGSNLMSSGINRQIQLRPRLKRVNFRDLLFLLEQEKETCRSATLYKAYLK